MVEKSTRCCTYLYFQPSSEDHCSIESYYYQNHGDDGSVVHSDGALLIVGLQDAHTHIASAPYPSSADSGVWETQPALVFLLASMFLSVCEVEMRMSWMLSVLVQGGHGIWAGGTHQHPPGLQVHPWQARDCK
jgi:hypothetical protein